MNEEITSVEMMDDDLGFTDADFEELTETGDHTGEEGGEEAEQAEAETTETTTQEDTAEQEPADQQELFELNYLGSVEKHTREEMIALAQMGKDRDRILQQRDAAQQYRTQNEPLVNDLSRIAQKVGMKPEALLSSIEANLLRQQGKTQTEAEAIIRANKADRQLQDYQTQERAARQQQEAAQRRQQQDVQEFVRRYPGLDYKTIPASVWQDVRKGDTLVNAYGRYEMQQLRAENQRLQQQIAAKQQNDKNKENSLGSMQSGAAIPKTDPFMEGFGQG